MDEFEKFAKFLVERGVQAIAEDPEGDKRIRVGNHRYWLENGKVICDRGTSLGLASPDSVEVLIKAMLHCYRNNKCEDCPMWVDHQTVGHPTPDGISTELYDRIGWSCGQPGKTCDTLCGRYAFHHCPLK